MAEAIKFPGSNRILGAPNGVENVNSLHVYANGKQCVSCWRLDANELAEVVKTGLIYLTVQFGQSQPPVFVGGYSETREMIADYGVWAQEKKNGNEA